MKRRGALALLALGILLAGGASVLVLGIARQASEASRAVIPQVYVVMAAREIPDQTQVTPDALVVRPFPADFAPATAIATPDQAVGKFAVGTIYKDQIILQGHVSVAKRAPSMEGDVIILQDIFRFDQTGLVRGKVQGTLRGTGIRPKFEQKLARNGVKLNDALFASGVNHRFGPEAAARPAAAPRGGH